MAFAAEMQLRTVAYLTGVGEPRVTETNRDLELTAVQASSIVHHAAGLYNRVVGPFLIVRRRIYRKHLQECARQARRRAAGIYS